MKNNAEPTPFMNLANVESIIVTNYPSMNERAINENIDIPYTINPKLIIIYRFSFMLNIFYTFEIVFPKMNAAILAPNGWALKIIPITFSEIPLYFAKGGKNGAIMANEIDDIKLHANKDLNKTSCPINNILIRKYLNNTILGHLLLLILKYGLWRIIFINFFH